MASLEMVTAYVETFTDRLTGVDRAKADTDGKSRLRDFNALYFAQGTNPSKPVLQVFTAAVNDIDLNHGLVHEPNWISNKLYSCPTSGVRGHVLVEAEHLESSISGPDNEYAQNGAAASDFLSPEIADRNDERLAFASSKEEGIQPPRTEYYL